MGSGGKLWNMVAFGVGGSHGDVEVVRKVDYCWKDGGGVLYGGGCGSSAGGCSSGW